MRKFTVRKFGREAPDRAWPSNPLVISMTIVVRV